LRFCKCGKVLKNGESCKNCKPETRKTKERGYGSDHRAASERHRTNYPLCERCMMVVGVESANISEHMHHIIAVKDDESRRMNFDNWLAVCVPCHDLLEGDAMAGIEVKQWSNQHYVEALNEGLS